MMENSALNKAHQQHRLADKHLRSHHYAEAIQCHVNAIDLLTDALKCTENPRSLESIMLQIDFHGNQKNVINIKREQHEHYRFSFENKSINRSEFGCDDNEGNRLTDAIYQKIEETDSLIELIQHQRQHSELHSSQSGADEVDMCQGKNEIQSNITAVKHPKDDKTVIEEFKILNKQLHLLISKLVNQLELSKKENEVLKGRLKQIEFEKEQNNQNQSNHLKVAADSSGGTSPFVFSPCSEYSSDVQDQTAILPARNNSATTQSIKSDSNENHN